MEESPQRITQLLSGGLGDEELESAIWPAHRPTATRTLRCRHCGQPNRIEIPAAVRAADRHRCGACGGALFLTRDEPLRGLHSSAYQHALDRQSLGVLRSVPGVPQFMRWLLEAVGDRSAQLLFMSDAIRCSDEQFPELIELMTRARHRLDIQVQPTVFLGESPHMNAMTTGVQDPVIVVRSALLDQMGDEELVAVMGHELGHLHAEHPLYQSVAQVLLQGASTASPIVRVFGLTIQRALLRWTRCAELTADRAALLASRSLRACIGVMLTFAGGNRPGTSRRTRMQLAPFIRQCRDLATIQRRDSLDRALGTYLNLDRTHPNVAWRVMHLIQWVEHGNYLNILSGDYIRRRRRALHEPRG